MYLFALLQGGFPSLAGLSGLGATVMAGGPISSQDQEKVSYISSCRAVDIGVMS